MRKLFLMAIVSAKEIRDKNVYIQTAREYSEVILSKCRW